MQHLDPPVRRTFTARRRLQKEAEAFVQMFDAQESLFELEVPEPPVIAPEGVSDISFERSRRRLPEGA